MKPSKLAEFMADSGYMPVTKEERNRGVWVRGLKSIPRPSEMLTLAYTTYLVLPEGRAYRLVDGDHPSRTLCSAIAKAARNHPMYGYKVEGTTVAQSASRAQTAIMRSLSPDWVAAKWLCRPHGRKGAAEGFMAWLLHDYPYVVHEGDMLRDIYLERTAVQAWRVEFARRLVADWQSQGL